MHTKNIYKECGPNKGTVDALKLELSQEFSNRILLGEMYYYYFFIGQPDVGSIFATVIKFSTKPSKYHYELFR